MATTKKLEMTRKWVKLSDSDCVVQCSNKLHIYVGDSPDDSSASVLVDLDAPTTLSFGASIWARKPVTTSGAEVTATVITK